MRQAGQTDARLFGGGQRDGTEGEPTRLAEKVTPCKIRDHC
jgi:hypothetical protein